MIPTLEQILGRVDDPETPVVWIDPVMPPDFWRALPGGLRRHGYHIFHIDEKGPVESRQALLERFDELCETNGSPIPDFDSLKSRLLALASAPGRGWAILFSDPDPLRQSDEEAFEELMETLEVVHETSFQIYSKLFTLIVRD